MEKEEKKNLYYNMKEIKILLRSNLESVVYTLLAAKARGESVYANFNGHKLFSDVITMDSAYLEVFGQTKSEIDKSQMEFKREDKILENIAIASIPDWNLRGQELIYPEKHEKWYECVKAQALGFYKGFDLDQALQIMEAIESESSMESVLELFHKQNHSGTTYSIVRSIVLDFSNKGPEFWEATANKEISAEDEEILEQKKAENLKLAELHGSNKTFAK